MVTISTMLWRGAWYMTSCAIPTTTNGEDVLSKKNAPLRGVQREIVIFCRNLLHNRVF